jgi:hypothetical protein
MKSFVTITIETIRGRTLAPSLAVLGAGIASVLMPLHVARADTLAYEVTIGSFADQFGIVDLNSGSFTPISTTSFTPVGLGELGSNLYTGVFAGEGTPANMFGQINPTTGAVTAISNSGLNGGNLFALGSTLNTIYALDTVPAVSGSFNLYSINPASGAATLIGPTGLVAGPAYQLSTGSPILYFSVNNDLYTLNTTTGAATLIGPTGLSGEGVDGLVYENGILYAGYSPDNNFDTSIYTINPATGTATFVTTEDPAAGLVYGLAPYPADTPLPAAFPLFATGLGGLGLLGWRRKRKSAAALAA